jgi:hypothetical protein
VKNLIRKILKENYALTNNWGRNTIYHVDINLGGLELVLQRSAGWRLLPKGGDDSVFKEGELEHIKTQLEERGIDGWYKTKGIGGVNHHTEHVELKFDDMGVVKMFLEMEPINLDKL